MRTDRWMRCCIFGLNIFQTFRKLWPIRNSTFQIRNSTFRFERIERSTFSDVWRRWQVLNLSAMHFPRKKWQFWKKIKSVLEMWKNFDFTPEQTLLPYYCVLTSLSFSLTKSNWGRDWFIKKNFIKKTFHQKLFYRIPREIV